MNERELLELKSRITTARAKVSELQGRQDFLMQELDKQWGCKTFKQGEAKLKALQSEIEKLNEQINTGITKLDEEMR